MRYFDSGVLLKLYLREPNSAEAVALVHEQLVAPPLTALHRLEMKAAIGQKRGRGEITEMEHDRVSADLATDLREGVFARIEADWPAVFARAESLAVTHAATNLCRSLDTLHVALALELGATDFCTFDGRQAVMAKAAGLLVVP